MTRATAVTAAVGVIVASAFALARAQQPAFADLLLTNGKIITVDERFTIAQAVAVGTSQEAGETWTSSCRASRR